MAQKKSYSKIIICLMLIFAFLFPLETNIVFADQATLNIGTLISDYSDGTPKDQEITDDLGFSFYDEETWDPVSFTDNEDNELILNDTFPYFSTSGQNSNIVSVVDFDDLEPEESFYYNGTSKKYSDLSNSSIDNKALLFVTSEDKVLGIKTRLNIPAQALYVLSFKVSVRSRTHSYGINAKIFSKDKDNKDVITAIPGIKDINTSYTTYYFLIRGNEYADKDITLYLFWGNLYKSGEAYASSKEKGYAAVSAFQMFSVNYNQYKDLSSDTSSSSYKQVNLYSTDPTNTFVPNGYFSLTANQIWNLSASNKINDFIPADWTQTTAETSPDNRVAHYGIINVNPTTFTNRMTDLGLNLINPGNHISSTNNNVLLLLNETTTYQTITSSEFTLTKNKYYEISFKFNTPALKSSADEETNSLSFYITNTSGGTIYSREDMFSYTEWSEDANEWTTFRVFIKASTSEDKKVKFVIKLGTEDATKEGYAYIDDVQLISKLNETNIYINNDEDTFILKGEEGSETSYLETGKMLSFTDLLQLDETKEVNRSLATYDYNTPTPPVDDDGDDDDDDDETSSTDLTYLWYVIPSILLALCTILGLITFYTKKLKTKIKLPSKKRKNSYDRRKTLEKQISDREKAELNSKKKNTENLNKELNKVKEQIKKLEEQYEKAKSNPLKLGEYVKKRERLQNQQTKLIDKINGKNNNN